MGLDWNTDNLTLLGVQSSDGGITYRGEKPFQRSVIFNVHDPVPSGPYCLFMGNPSTGWIVMDTPNVAGTTYQFNLKFDHTYMTSSWSGEWSAGVTWDDSIKGNASYKVTLKENETKWSKGAFYSCVWPCG
jgi:hypothetical protein